MCGPTGAPSHVGSRTRAGGQLPEHQGSAGPDLPHGGQHDQGCASACCSPCWPCCAGALLTQSVRHAGKTPEEIRKHFNIEVGLACDGTNVCELSMQARPACGRRTTSPPRRRRRSGGEPVGIRVACWLLGPGRSVFSPKGAHCVRRHPAQLRRHCMACALPGQTPARCAAWTLACDAYRPLAHAAKLQGTGADNRSKLALQDRSTGAGQPTLLSWACCPVCLAALRTCDHRQQDVFRLRADRGDPAGRPHPRWGHQDGGPAQRLPGAPARGR